jgi:hypothetical protein
MRGTMPILMYPQMGETLLLSAQGSLWKFSFVKKPSP